MFRGGRLARPRSDDSRPVDGVGGLQLLEIAEAVGHRGPHRLQPLLSRAVWDYRQVLDRAAAWAVARLDEGDAVLVVDETADEKSSAGAVGTARQYSGTAGGIALCQVAVALTFATSRGYTLTDRYDLPAPGDQRGFMAQLPRSRGHRILVILRRHRP